MHRIEHNVETGEILQIELTEEEVKEFLVRQKEAEKAQAAEAQKAADRAALLAQLGITEEQAKLLLG
jgi:hypothetical protein